MKEPQMAEEIGERIVAEPPDTAESDVAPDLETVLHVIWDRIEALDAYKRSIRLKMAFGLAAVLTFTATLGVFVLADTAWRKNPTELAIRDSEGRVRARLGIDSRNGAPMLRLLDERGHRQAALSTGVAGPALSLYDDVGSSSPRIGLNSRSPILEATDSRIGQTVRIDLTTFPPRASTALEPRRGARSTVANRDSDAPPRVIDVKEQPCRSSSDDCRMIDARARFGSAG
jgi:hypothetical protein